MQRSTHNNISSSIMTRMAVFENNTNTNNEEAQKFVAAAGSPSRSVAELRRTMMSMSSSPPPGVQTDADGLIVPKKLINPCLESTDRKELHRELKFNNRIGKSVLNQKSELQRAYEKQKERHAVLEQQQQQQQLQPSPIADSAGGIPGLKGELGRVIMERAQKHEAAAQKQDADADEERQYVNPEYLNVRAKLRTAHAPN